MTRISRFIALFIGCIAVAFVLGPAFDAAGQEKKDEKKVEKKTDKKEEKKVEKKEDKKEEKKDDKKKEEKKVEEKKVEPFKPDVPQAEIKAHGNWIYALSLSQDGKLLATAGRDRTVKVWDLAAKKDIQTFKGFPSDVKSVLFIDGKIASTTGTWRKEKEKVKEKDKEVEKVKEYWEGEIRIGDVKSGKQERTIRGHGATIEAAALSKDGKTLVTASDDETAKIWDVAAGKDTQTLKGHTGAVIGVAVTGDGKKVATCSKDSTLKIWDAATGKELASFKVERIVKVEVKNDEKGKKKEAPKDKDKKEEPKTKQEKETKVLGREFTVVAFSPDGKRLAAGNLDGEIKIYDVDGAKEVRELKAPDGVWALAFSPDGSKLASGGWDQTIKVWDAASGKDVNTIKAHIGTVTTLVFSNDGQQIISGGLDGLVKIWNAAKK